MARCCASAPADCARFRVMKGEVQVARPDIKAALALLQPELPAELASRDVAVRRLTAEGYAYCYKPDFDQAERLLDEAETLAARTAPELRGAVLLRRGTMWVFRNELDLAEKDFREALATGRNRQDRILQSNALGSLGFLAIRRAHFDEAIDYATASTELARAEHCDLNVEKNTGNTASCLLRLGNLELAAKLFEKSFALAQALDIPKDEVAWLLSLGDLTYRRGELERARELFRKAQTIAHNAGMTEDAARALANLSQVSIDLGRYDDAERYNREALAIKRSNGNEVSALYSVFHEGRIAAARGKGADAEALFRRVVAEADFDKSLRWDAQTQLARLYARQNKPQLAEAAFRQAIATGDEARHAVLREEHRLSFQNAAGTFYDDYIDFLAGQKRFDQALVVAEQARARTLEEGLGVEPVTATQMNPSAVARRFGGPVLEYWLGAAGSHLWIVTSRGVTHASLPPRETIEREVEAYARDLVGPRDPLMTGSPRGAGLFSMLVGPAVATIERSAHVAVVPDRRLYALNFETLIVPAPAPHYWIEDVTMTTCSSLALLAHTTKQVGTERSILVVGNPPTPSPEFPALAHAAEEIQRIQRAFDGRPVDVLSGSAATARAYVAQASRSYDFIHFVAHGVASRESPLDSAVVLAKDGEASKLYAREIVRHPLRARLVTISSCSGAGSAAYSGEGLVGLAWAFLRAGARQVVAALWEVNDTATPEMMERMYTSLNAGRDPATALREAKLALLHSGSVYSRPFYWAPFVLYSGG
ncbi:MAG TPA: CHAT domain-containing tetratricopeptide repeat protein [Thermoanaerobaculia bacterium]|nr:CHAT domain-containing tetratricopeptide repeat protein [Thermoanaerobaculia bacterium]